MNSLPGKPRGVLRPLTEDNAFQHERRQPCAPLADWVEHFWYVRWDLRHMPSHLQETLPHPHVHLVVERGAAHIHGVHSARFQRHLAGRDYAFGIKFKPGGFYPFLQAPVSGLLNRSLPAQAVFGMAAQTLAQRMDACTQMDAMVAVAQSFLLSHLPQHDPYVARVSALVDRIANDLNITSVDQLMAVAAIDKRALQRLFQKYVGIGAKWAIKRYRLHEALAQIQDGNVQSWAALSLDLGYFDQAHFVRDFHALVGQSPAEYARSVVSKRTHLPWVADRSSPPPTENSGLLHHLR